MAEDKLVNTFKDLGVCDQLVEACENLGWKIPSKIQAEAIPHALDGKDLIGLAQTGSGKTGAFALPILQALLNSPKAFFACVLSPTRELAIQIHEQFEALGSGIGVKCAVLVGGVNMKEQIKNLEAQPHIIVATPGRLVDHLCNTKGFSLRTLKYLVLDEADKLLNEEFEKSIDEILNVVPRERSTYLFSATMTKKVKKLQRACLRSNAVKIEVASKYSTVDTHIDMPAEIFSIVGSNEEKHAKGAQQWQNTITGVGQRFSSVHEFRESLRKYAIAHQFAFRYKKNDSHRVTVKCKAEGCPWRIHASRLSTTQLICIKKMNAVHTCEGAVATTGHQATRSWVASIIKEKLKVCPNYKPKDIVNDIKQEYGIQLNYFQAWRGKEIAKEQLQGSYKEAYNQLPFFCEKIMETNPGSLANFTTKEDSSFHRLFVSFHASLYGFQQGCRPLLFLDSIPLKSKYQGTLLAATAADGDDGVFPVAFAVVDAESDDNWHWFLLQLRSALSASRPTTFVADRRKGLRESIASIFTGSHHGYCLRYLTEQLFRDLKGQFSHEVKRLMVEDFYAAAYARTHESFQRCIESIKSISLEAYNWIIQSEPQNWANSYFQGARYNHMTSNFGEPFYSWASDAHELPITQMVDVIRSKIMELIYARRADSDEWLTRLTPSVEEKLKKESHKAHSLQVLLPAGGTFEVRGDSIEVVDIDNWHCSCKGWQLTGLPCCHTIAVIGCMGRSPFDYCSRYFTIESYRLTYSESVHSIPNVDMPVQRDSSQLTVTVTPPPTRRPPGRPTTKRHGPQEVVKRQLQCSKCKGLGHNKSTCKEFI